MRCRGGASALGSGSTGCPRHRKGVQPGPLLAGAGETDYAGVDTRTKNVGYPEPPETPVSNANFSSADVISQQRLWDLLMDVAKHGATTFTSRFTGMFRDNPAEQARFLSMVRGTQR